MGSGKSTLGQAYAKKMGWQFIDTDSLIEEKEGTTISQMFVQYGENYFREKERVTLKELEKSHHCIIATGGGTPLFNPTIGQIGKVYFLDLPFQSILERMTNEERQKRPLFSNLSIAEQLYNERRERYLALADVVLDATRLPEDNIALMGT